MDKLYIKRLVVEAEDIDPQNEVLENENSRKRFAEMAKNLNEAIEYLDTCDAIEFWWATEVLEELAEFFRSQELIA